MANKSLGRGLSAFLQTEINTDASTAVVSGDGNSVVKINLESIKANPYQPRQFFDDEQLRSLAASIKRKGVFQPILVQKLADGTYQLVAGERRMRASQLAGLAEIPAIITDFSPEEQLEVAILENVQRENLNPIEEAEGYKRLLDEFDHTQEQLSEIIGKSRSHISNVMRLLNLPDDVKQMIKEGKLSFGHARALVTSDDASAVARKVLEGSLNVRDTEKLVRRRKNPQMDRDQYSGDQNSGGRSSDPKNSGDRNSKDFSSANRNPDKCEATLFEFSSYIDPEILNISHQISELSGLKANVKLRENSSGIVELSFDNLNQLDSFIQKINH